MKNLYLYESVRRDVIVWVNIHDNRKIPPLPPKKRKRSLSLPSQEIASLLVGVCWSERLSYYYSAEKDLQS